MFYLVPESGTRQKLVPDCMTHVPETGTSFLVPVSGQYVMGISYAWSQDKDGGHTIRSATDDNPKLHANFMALFYRTRVIADGSFTLTLHK